MEFFISYFYEENVFDFHTKKELFYKNLRTTASLISREIFLKTDSGNVTQ